MALHTILITFHAASAVAALFVGLYALVQMTITRPPPKAGAALAFRVYLAALSLMILFLIVVVAVDWPGLGLASRILYVALATLALYTGWRGWRALQTERQRNTGWRARYVDDIGFTLITLLVGFVVIGALDVGLPLWLVILLGVLVIFCGRIGVQRAKGAVETHPSPT